MRRLSALFLVLIIVFSTIISVVAVYAEPESANLLPDSTEVRETLTKVASFQLATVTNPSVGTIGGEWTVLALARDGSITDTFKDTYLTNLTNVLNETNGTLAAPGEPYTEYSRVILALTSLGLDPSDFEGFNLLAPLAEFENVAAQGTNGVTFALIALNSANYEIPKLPDDSLYTQTTRELLIENILNAQFTDGGWAISPIMPSSTPDFTAMAIQALAPFYGQNIEITEAIAQAVIRLSETQMNSGGFGAAEANAQVIIALNALGIPLDDPRFVKNGNTLYDDLMNFFIAESGGFRRGATVNPMTTDQAMYALVCFYRTLTGANWLYDMRDAFNGSIPPVTIPVNKIALHEAIAEAQNRTQSNYTPASWTVMQTALSTAKEVAEAENTTQTEVNTARDNLLFAINALTRVSTGGGNFQGTQPSRVFISVRDPNARAGQTSIFFAGQYFDIHAGETAYSLLRRTNLNIVTRGQAALGGIYVVSINGWSEFSDGPLSGWMFRVNGAFPDDSASARVLQNGDRVEWLFSRNLGADLGGGTVTGGANSGAGNTTVSDDDIDDSDESDHKDTGEDTKVISVITETEWKNPFADISSDSWYYAYVRFAYTNRLMNGTGNGEFSPNINLSRAMIITILARLAKVDTTGGETWYSQAVEWGIENSITDGSNLQDNIAREQMAALLYRFAQYKGLQTESGEFTAEFTDADTISDWAQNAMTWANSNGLITGRTLKTLAPMENATRAETAAILQRFIENIISKIGEHDIKY